MAKATTPSAADSADESCSLAERLFAANWNPASGYMPESVAQKCIEAADAFYRVHRKLAESRINEAA